MALALQIEKTDAEEPSLKGEEMMGKLRNHLWVNIIPTIGMLAAMVCAMLFGQYLAYRNEMTS